MEWGTDLLKRIMGVLVNSKLNMNQQCTLREKEANNILGCIQRHIKSRLGEVIIPLFAAILRPHLEYCMQFSAPQYKEDKLNET